MCIQCGSPFDCRFNSQRLGLSPHGLLGSAPIKSNQQNPNSTMSIKDKKFIVMQVGCNNLLGVFDTRDEALDMATKWAKKNIVKLHIFELHSTVESENKIEVTQVKT